MLIELKYILGKKRITQHVCIMQLIDFQDVLNSVYAPLFLLIYILTV